MSYQSNESSLQQDLSNNKFSYEIIKEDGTKIVDESTENFIYNGFVFEAPTDIELSHKNKNVYKINKYTATVKGKEVKIVSIVCQDASSYEITDYIYEQMGETVKYRGFVSYVMPARTYENNLNEDGVLQIAHRYDSYLPNFEEFVDEDEDGVLDRDENSGELITRDEYGSTLTKIVVDVLANGKLSESTIIPNLTVKKWSYSLDETSGTLTKIISTCNVSMNGELSLCEEQKFEDLITHEHTNDVIIEMPLIPPFIIL